MTPSQHIAQARYHNGRGVRMLKCATGVGACRQRAAFIHLAQAAFDARDFHIWEARNA